MKEFLKGNYKVEARIEETSDERSRLEAEFERKALSRLGGSICFVSKKGFVWTGDQAAEDPVEGEGSGAESRAPRSEREA